MADKISKMFVCLLLILLLLLQVTKLNFEIGYKSVIINSSVLRKTEQWFHLLMIDDGSNGIHEPKQL